MTQGPDPRASLRGLTALVLDMVRIDADRRPSAEVRRWHHELAASLGAPAEYPRTSRELLEALLRLSRAIEEPGRDLELTAEAERAA
jgi:hypothetical protein